MHLSRFIIPAFIIATACQPHSGEQTARSTENSPMDSVYYNINTYSKEYGDCASDTSAYCTRVNINYPVFISESRKIQVENINDRIEQQLLKQFYPDTAETKSIPEFAEQFILDYKEIRANFGEALGWYARLNGSVLRNDSSIIVVELISDLYTGGAHGNVMVQYLNFDPVTGTIFELDSVFKSGYQDELNRIVERKFREIHGLEPGTDLSDEGFQFENERYYNPDNFALLSKGIKFYYNNYEIAPYSSGSFEVMVRYEDLDDLLSRDLD